MNKEITSKIEEIIEMLPKLDCGACGFKSCELFADFVEKNPDELKRCIHLNGKTEKLQNMIGCKACVSSAIGEKMEWKDNLQRDFDFILDCFENEPGPKETILLYNPALVKDLDIKKGDILVGRPMGMSCGCPVTHCGIVTAADPRNGVVYWCVTGPLKPRSEGFKDIGFYVSQAYEGLIKESKVPIKLGMRYWFLPRRCMLQWRHSGLVNAVTKMKDGSLKIRVEGLLIG
jgi:uncharacterized Fe-S cluster-containing protein